LKLSRILIILGLAMLLAAGGFAGYNLWDSARAKKLSAELLVKLEAAMEERSGSSAAESASGESEPEATVETSDGQTGEEEVSFLRDPNRVMPAIEIDGYRYIGILSIPDIDLELPVLEECDDYRLTISICAYSGSVYRQNLIIAGHSYASLFAEIRWLPLGTEIHFTDTEGNVWSYVLDSVERLYPNQGKDLIASSEDESNGWDLTLFTCYPGAQTRCVLRCSSLE